MAIEIGEQILEAARAALYNAIPAVGTRVERARTDPWDRAECPGIEIAALSDQADLATVQGDVHDCTLTFVLAIHVQGGAGVWESAASAIATLAHPLVLNLAKPAGVAEIFGPVSSDFVASPGDGRPAYRTLAYQARYFRAAAALDTAA